jgi:ankyrin repeat protein
MAKCADNTDKAYVLTDTISDQLITAAKQGDLESLRKIVPLRSKSSSVGNMLYYMKDLCFGQLEPIAISSGTYKYALWQAALKGHLEIVQHLVGELSEDIIDTEAFLWCLSDPEIYQHHNILQYLLHNKRCLNFTPREWSDILINNIQCGQLDVLDYLLDKLKLNINGLEVILNTSLVKGYRNVTTYILDYSNLKDIAYKTWPDIIRNAIKGCNNDIVKLILKDVRSQHIDACELMCILKYAIQLSSKTAIEILLSNSRIKNISAKDADDILESAAKANSIEIIRMILEHNICNVISIKALQNSMVAIASNGNLEALQYLLKHSKATQITEAGKIEILYGAARSGKLDVTKYWLSYHSQGTIASQDWSRIMFAAVYSGNLVVIQYLFLDNRTANLPLKYWQDSIFAAINNDDTSVIKYLLKHKLTNFDRLKAEWRAALNVAVCKGKLGALQSVLLDYRVRVTLTSIELANLFYRAIDNKHLPIICTILHVIDDKFPNLCLKSNDLEYVIVLLSDEQTIKFNHFGAVLRHVCQEDRYHVYKNINACDVIEMMAHGAGILPNELITITGLVPRDAKYKNMPTYYKFMHALRDAKAAIIDTTTSTVHNPIASTLATLFQAPEDTTTIHIQDSITGYVSYIAHIENVLKEESDLPTSLIESSIICDYVGFGSGVKF